MRLPAPSAAQTATCTSICQPPQRLSLSRNSPIGRQKNGAGRHLYYQSPLSKCMSIQWVYFCDRITYTLGQINLILPGCKNSMRGGYKQIFILLLLRSDDLCTIYFAQTATCPLGSVQNGFPQKKPVFYARSKDGISASEPKILTQSNEERRARQTVAAIALLFPTAHWIFGAMQVLFPASSFGKLVGFNGRFPAFPCPVWF